MSLKVVGLGPGSEEGMTFRACEALEGCDFVVSYSGYVDLLPEVEAELVTSGMGGEVERAERAVELAGEADVCLVSSGDPNVYALAGLALEVMGSRGVEPSEFGFEVVPGVPAANSCAARVGAPLVSDYISISLSDRLVEWGEIVGRLEAVAPLDIAVVLYNPWSSGRRENYLEACSLLLEHRDPGTLCAVVQGAGRGRERSRVLRLEELPGLDGDPILSMTSTVIVGREDTFELDGFLVSPRDYGRKYDY